MSKDKAVHPLVAKIEAARAAFQAEGKKVLSEDFKAFFAEVPEVAEVRWNQYTPFFNDGEACVFSVNDASFIANKTASFSEDVAKKVAEAYDDDDDPGYYDLVGHIKRSTSLHWDKKLSLRAPTSREKEVLASCARLNSLTCGLGDIMKAVFGDHVRVVATANGFDVTEYEHE